MAKKRNSLVIIIGLLAIFVIIQACSLPIAKKTEAPAEVIVAPEEKTEEIFLPLVEGSEETEAEVETEAPAEEAAAEEAATEAPAEEAAAEEAPAEEAPAEEAPAEEPAAEEAPAEEASEEAGEEKTEG